jgi:hypothetical protein
MAKVSQRKAPGAMSAIALLVSPVNPSVACICGAFCSAMNILLKRLLILGPFPVLHPGMLYNDSPALAIRIWASLLIAAERDLLVRGLSRSL